MIKLVAQGYITGQRQKCELETIPLAFQRSSWTPEYPEFLSLRYKKLSSEKSVLIPLTKKSMELLIHWLGILQLF